MTESTTPAPEAALSDTEVLEQFAEREYTEGFYTDVEADSAPTGLDEGTIAFISGKKEEPEWLLEWRLKSYRAWLKMEDPTKRPVPERWAMVHYPDIDFQAISYFSAPKRVSLNCGVGRYNCGPNTRTVNGAEGLDVPGAASTPVVAWQPPRRKP